MSGMLTEAIVKMTSRERPLAGLSNEALFQYPEADPSDEAGRKFRHELLHRRGVTADKVKEKLNQAKANLDQAQRAFDSNQDEKRNAELQNILNKRKEALAVAQQASKDVEGKATWLTTSDINGHFREKNLHRLNPLIERWKAGRLFNSQEYGFTSFLTTSEKERNHDQLQYEEFRAIAHSCTEEGGKLYEEINAFWQVRIMPSLTKRERFTEGEGEAKTLCAIMGLSEPMKKEYWAWHRVYNAMTVKYQWKDDGGVAYSKQAELSQPEPFTEFKGQF